LPPDQIQQRDSWSFPNSDYRLQKVSSHHNLIVSTIPSIFFSFFSIFFPACCSPFVPSKRQNPNKNYPLLYKPISQRSFQKVGWKPNQKASDFVSQNLPFFHPPFFPPFLSVCQPAREKSVIPSLLLSSTRTCNRRRPGRVLCREVDLFGVALFSASPLSCGGRSRPAFATTVRSSSDCKRTGSEERKRILQSGTGTRIIFFFKMRKNLKNEKGRIFCHNILVFSFLIQIILNSDFSLVGKKKLIIFLIV
jgi:hypothetical protein